MSRFDLPTKRRATEIRQERWRGLTATAAEAP